MQTACQNALEAEQCDLSGTTMPVTLLSPERANDSTELRFVSVLKFSSVWYWQLDRDYRFVASPFDLPQDQGKRSAGYLKKLAWEFDFFGISREEVERWKVVLLKREPFQNLIYLRESVDGEYRWVCSHGDPIFDEHGSFHGYHGLSQDITQSRQAQQREAIQAA